MKVGEAGEVVKEVSVEKPGGNAVRLVQVERKLSRLEKLERRGVITPAQCDVARHFLGCYEAHYGRIGPTSIEDHAPTAPVSDPFARWTRGQTAVDRKGRRRRLPPTFRPKPTRERRRGHDGWTGGRLHAMREWWQCQGAINELERDHPFIAATVAAVVFHGLSVAECTRALFPGSNGFGRLNLQVGAALRTGLRALGKELTPQFKEVA